MAQGPYLDPIGRGLPTHPASGNLKGSGKDLRGMAMRRLPVYSGSGWR